MAKLCIETALDPGRTARSSGGLFRFIVLGLLHACGPQHGYGLMKAFERRSGLRVSSGNFYRELRRLVGAGLVAEVPKGGARGDRRQSYTISRDGSLTFQNWFSMAPSRAGGGPDDLSARTLFFGDMSDGAVAQLLESWERDVWFQSKALERTRASALAAANGHEFPVQALLLSRHARRLALDVEFLNQVRTALCEWAAQRADESTAATADRDDPARSRPRRARKRVSGSAAASCR